MSDLPSKFTTAVTGKKFKEAINIAQQMPQQELQDTLNSLIYMYAKWGNMDKLQFCLTDERLPVRADIHFYNDFAVMQAALFFNFDIVRYMLTSPELKEHAHIHAQGGVVLSCAGENENIPFMEFLLHSDELKQKADVHYSDDSCFKMVCFKHKVKSLKYLIYEYGIKKTPVIEELLDSAPQYQYIKDMFKKRDFYYELQQNLPLSSNKKMRHKL